MKILHLATHLNRGGISQYILSVGEALGPRGHEIFVGSSGGEMEEEFKQRGITPKTFSIRTKSELDPRIYWALPPLIRWIVGEKINLIHAHTRITQVMAAWAGVLTSVPFVTTAHGFYKRRLGRRLFPAWGKRVVAISDPVAEHLRDNFKVPADRIRVVYNGVDLQGFVARFERHDRKEVRKEFGIPESAQVAGVTARLVPDKGHEYLIRALKQLESEFPELHVLIVGDGRHRRYLGGLAQDLRLTGRVHFAGTLRDVSKPLRAMDFFVLPAIWREGFGLSIAEAMACQKPVIVTNIWALNALIQDGVNGILVEPKNVENLASAIRKILKDNAFREWLGLAGQRTARERFSLDRMVRELEAVYEEVLSLRRSPREVQ